MKLEFVVESTMYTYYIRNLQFGNKIPEIIAWSCKRNDDLIDFESRVSGCRRCRISDSPKYTKEQILKQEVKELGAVRTVQGEMRPSDVWSMISEGKFEELTRLLGL